MTDNPNGAKPKPTPQEPRPERRARKRKLAQVIQKLNLENGNVILVKRGTKLAEQGHLNQLGNTIGEMGFTQQIILIVLDDFSDLSILNEAEMNKLGWQRIPQPTEEPPATE